MVVNEIFAEEKKNMDKNEIKLKLDDIWEDYDTDVIKNTDQLFGKVWKLFSSELSNAYEKGYSDARDRYREREKLGVK